MAAKDGVGVSVDTTPGQQQAPGGEKETTHQAAQPEREAGWGDYFRVFTYAKKWDFALMVGAAVASIAAGVVSPHNPAGIRASFPHTDIYIYLFKR